MFDKGNAMFDGMKNFMNTEHMMNAMKSTPTPDFTNFTNNCKKGADAVTATTQLATESAHALARRGAEMVQNQMTESFNALKEMTSSTNPEQVAARQQEFLRSTVENTLAGAKEMMDIASKSAMEIFETTGKKMSEGLGECVAASKK